MRTSQQTHRLRRGLALPLALILALLLPLGAWAWSGSGHFVLESIGYTDGNHARAYTVAPNFRQASGSLNQANSTISSADAADVYVNFNYDTTGKSVYVVYTTDGSAPNKSNGTSVAAAFSKYADPNRTWYATIPAQTVGVTVNYVFYISDSDLASGYGRISGAAAARNTSQYETSWSEDDGDYFTYSVCGRAITVTSAADSGAGSLRQAIVDACPGGTVTFNNTLAGQTITLMSGELSLITKTLTVDGGSQGVTVSGNVITRVFNIGASSVVTLSHLSIVSGSSSLSGGGIYNAGALTVQDCVLSDNVSTDNGGGISNVDGVLTVQNSVLSGNRADKGGGGIGNQGMLTLQDSTLSGNAATYGGGLFNSNNGQITVHNSTLSGNAATGTGDYDGGGAIDQGIGSVSTTISNSTLVSNTAASPNQTTSGIWLEDGVLTLHNSIVAHNNGANNFKQEAGTTFTSQGYNLSNAWNGLTTHATDLTGDPLLGALGDYGGGTETVPLRAGSPAIDAGDPDDCPAADQRGFPRNDLRCDIGAYEWQISDPGGDTVVRSGLTIGEPYTFGPTRVRVTVTGGDAGTITATKHLATPGGLYNTGELTATWWLTASQSPFTVTLALCYTEEDIAGLMEAKLRAFRWYTGTGGVLTWTDPISTGLTVDEDANCVILTGIEGFSAWTLFDTSQDAAPTAIGSRGGTAGGIHQGWPLLAGVLLTLGGVTALRCRRR